MALTNIRYIFYKFDTLLQKILYFELKYGGKCQEFLSIISPQYGDWENLSFIPWVNLVLDGRSAFIPHVPIVI